MSRIAVLGTYDGTPSSLFQVDLMRYLAGVGHAPVAVIFRGTHPFDADIAVNRPLTVDAHHVVVPVTRFDDPAAIEVVRSLDLDLLVYAGGRDILRAPMLQAARLGCIGGHYGRLPTIRGMGTVEWSVIEGVPPTVAIQRINPGIDTGAVIMQAAVPLQPGDTFTAIRERSYLMTKVMLALAAEALLAGRTLGTPQEATEGRQYFRMHPALTALAERRLDQQLRGWRRGAWIGGAG